MLTENFERRIRTVAVYLGQAGRKDISNVARSAYYRSAIMLICTIVESLVFNLVEKETAKTNGVLEKRKKLRELHRIPSSVFGKDGVVIAEESEEDIVLRKAHFGDMNDYLKHNHIITNTEFKQLDYVRKERNKLHLQSLIAPDTGYTKQKVVKVSKPLVFLNNKLRGR